MKRKKTNMKKIRVLIADDHMIVRIGLSTLIGSQDDLEIVGEADTGVAAVQEAVRLKPDVVVMDLMMPRMDGTEATAEICQKAPGVKVIILTSYSTSDGIAHALDVGAVGALTKTADDSSLLAAIRTVANGGRFISPRIERMLCESPPVPKLTDKQREIVRSMARGLSNADIASQFGISPTVVREHITTILEKIGAANRTEAVAIALSKQLLKP